MTIDYASEKYADRALKYLVDNDVLFADLTVELDSKHKDLADNERAYKEEIKKQISTIEGSNATEREGKALRKGAVTHYAERHTKLRKEYEDLLRKHTEMKYKRESAELCIRLWQSVNANRRQGQVM